MFLYTKVECETWMSGRGKTLSGLAPALTLWYPPNPADFDGLWLANALCGQEPVMLWITEWGIWPSSENWHLYYRLRQSYGDTRQLHEAPGHLFLNYEMNDLATFLQVAMTNGWGGHIVPASPYASNVFFSHDEYIDFAPCERSPFISDAARHFDHLLTPPQAFQSQSTRTRYSETGKVLTPTDVHDEPHGGK